MWLLDFDDQNCFKEEAKIVGNEDETEPKKNLLRSGLEFEL